MQNLLRPVAAILSMMAVASALHAEQVDDKSQLTTKNEVFLSQSPTRTLEEAVTEVDLALGDFAAEYSIETRTRELNGQQDGFVERLQIGRYFSIRNEGNFSILKRTSSILPIDGSTEPREFVHKRGWVFEGSDLIGFVENDTLIQDPLELEEYPDVMIPFGFPLNMSLAQESDGRVRTLDYAERKALHHEKFASQVVEPLAGGGYRVTRQLPGHDGLSSYGWNVQSIFRSTYDELHRPTEWAWLYVHENNGEVEESPVHVTKVTRYVDAWPGRLVILRYQSPWSFLQIDGKNWEQLKQCEEQAEETRLASWTEMNLLEIRDPVPGDPVRIGDIAPFVSMIGSGNINSTFPVPAVMPNESGELVQVLAYDSSADRFLPVAP